MNVEQGVSVTMTEGLIINGQDIAFDFQHIKTKILQEYYEELMDDIEVSNLSLNQKEFLINLLERELNTVLENK